MSASTNMVVLLGNVGADPEIRHTQDGRPIANFRMATSEQWRDKETGEKKEATEWHTIVVFAEGLAKVVEEYVKKGSKIQVIGKLQTRKWTDSDGNDRYTTEVTVNRFGGSIVLCGESGGRSGNYPPPASGEEDYGKRTTQPPQADGAGSPPPSFAQPGLDDEIPF